MEIDFREIMVATIGTEARSDEIDGTFTFQSKSYKMQLRWPHFNKLLDLNRSSGFYLKNISLEGQELVVLCYNNSRITESSERSGRPERLFLVKAFFEGVDDAKPNTNTNAKQLTMDEFYERLKQKHLDDDLVPGIPTEVQHPSLRPVLRPYQKKGISWMLSRELVPSTLPFNKPWIKLRPRLDKSQHVYFNEQTQLLVFDGPELFQTPKGGLLADEMGLGKTVQVIGLMLMNPHRAAIKRKASEIDENENSGNSTNKNSSSTVKCVCGNVDKKKTLLTCTMCPTQQHGMCVFRRDATADDRANYVCTFCWQSSGRIIDAKTTIVVTPASIKFQWMDEIQRHVADKSFKVFMYEGVSSGYLHPTELAKYDVILADYSTLAKELSREIYCKDTLAVERRLSLRSSGYGYPPSPLTSVRWWRVVLDEAQMVENKDHRPSRMVKLLPAVHRWATTGTPIEKNSLQCLYGLIFYLNVDPYTNEGLFNQMLGEYQSGKHEHLIDVVSSVMWRTCKKDVEHEINIPKQSEVVHEVAMTDLQEYYYREAHIQSSREFKENVHAYMRRNLLLHWVTFTKQEGDKTVTVRELAVDPPMKDIFLHKLKNATSRTFMDPLISLRQDCTIPSKTPRLIDQPKVKKVLRPEQLHEHLVKESTLEAKSALRTVFSSINGQAAIKIAENKNQEAIALYNQVLTLAKDCDKFVNSKLLIHAHNGLLDIAALTGVKNESHDENASKMAQLEWKHISKRAGNVEEINQEHRKHAREMEKTKKDLVDVKGHWWSNIIGVHRNGEDDGRFMEIINAECFQSVPDSLALVQNVRSTHGISVIITKWSNKIQEYMKEINKRFSHLDFIVNNLRPSNEMSAEEKVEIGTLVQAAVKCHLNQLNGNRNANPTRQGLCDLCELKEKLDEFECLLFDKSLVGGIVKGSNSPRFEEKLIKAILTYARRSKFEAETLEMGNNFFKRLEAIKAQFKIHAKLYVAVDSIVSAYDELKMCKARIQVVESPKDITQEDARSRMKIVRRKVPEQTKIFTSQKQEAEIKFASVNARLKYLEHLKEPNKIQPCPICFEVPQERYYVAICGHTICAPCLVKMITNHSIICPFCRTVQETKKMYAVACHDNTPLELINGSYSPKIDEIIRCILRLKSVEPDVKILIFSQWDQSLEAISIGLKANNIEFRSKMHMHSTFSKKVQAFKNATSNVTCLLLNLYLGSKGLNLTEATHVFLVEPILKADDEMQAIGRVHRIGQTKETFVHRFITKRTIESTIYSHIIQQREKWARKEFTINDIEKLLDVNPDQDIDADDE